MLRDSLQELASACEAILVPHMADNLEKGLERLRELLSQVDLRKLAEGLATSGIDLVAQVKQFRTEVALANQASQAGEETAPMQIAMQMSLQDLVGLVGLGAPEGCGSKDIQPCLMNALQWAFKLTLRGDREGGKLAGIMAYLARCFAGLPPRMLFDAAPALNNFMMGVAQVRFDFDSDEAWPHIVLLRQVLGEALRDLNRTGLVSLAEIDRLSRMRPEPAGDASDDGQALVRDAVKALVHELEREGDFPDLVRSLQDFLRGFNLERLKLELRRFGQQMGPEFHAFSTALSRATLEGERLAADKAVAGFRSACAALARALNRAIEAPWQSRSEPSPPRERLPLAMTVEALLAHMQLGLLFFKQDPDGNRGNVKILVDLLGNLLTGADLGAARTELLALGGRDLAQSALRLAAAVGTASAAELHDRLGEKEVDEVRRAMRSLLDDLAAAGVGGPLGSLHLGMDEWIRGTQGIILGPAATPIVDQLNDLLMRADAALNDPAFASIVERLQQALAPDLPSVRLQRMALRGGDDFFSRVDALREAMARVEQPQPGDDPDASFQALEAAVLAVDRLFVRLGLLYEEDEATPSPPGTPPGRRNA